MVGKSASYTSWGLKNIKSKIPYMVQGGVSVEGRLLIFSSREKARKWISVMGYKRVLIPVKIWIQEIYK